MTEEEAYREIQERARRERQTLASVAAAILRP